MEKNFHQPNTPYVINSEVKSNDGEVGYLAAVCADLTGGQQQEIIQEEGNTLQAQYKEKEDYIISTNNNTELYKDFS